ncbi:hypothetical protein VNI00_010244 [Paramarasmius palmivorus]|uniref:Uncharacterized protein n=1 Tax=Paramarasmius palmivorus TaxID=297713 RepID=A0AAW0CJ12_9AGAR
MSTQAAGFILSSDIRPNTSNLGVTTLGLAGSEALSITAAAIGLNNVLLSALIGTVSSKMGHFSSHFAAFKIWDMSHELVTYLGAKARNIYGTIIVATLESGLLYSAYLSVVVSLGLDLIRRKDSWETSFSETNYAFETRNKAFAVCVRIWAPIAGIASTIIIVRVALGISFDEVHTTLQSMHFAAVPAPNENTSINSPNGDMTSISQPRTFSQPNNSQSGLGSEGVVEQAILSDADHALPCTARVPDQV